MTELVVEFWGYFLGNFLGNFLDNFLGNFWATFWATFWAIWGTIWGQFWGRLGGYHVIILIISSIISHDRTGCGVSRDILGMFWELFFGLFLGRYMGLPRLFCGVLFQIIFIVTLVEYKYVPFKFRSGLQEKTHHSMVTVLCQINIFCHQLTPSTTTDFVRFSKQKVCKFWTSE